MANEAIFFTNFYLRIIFNYYKLTTKTIIYAFANIMLRHISERNCMHA